MDENSRHFELINRAIDGNLSSEEKDELDIYLESNPEAKKLLDDMTQVDDCLKNTEKVDVPPEIKANILKAIRPVRRIDKEKPSIFDLMGEFFGIRTLRYAAVFSAGLVLGIVGLSLISQKFDNRLDNSQLAGTAILSNDLSSFQLVDSKKFTVEQIEGEIEIKRLDESVVLDLAVNTPREVHILIKYDENLLNPGTISRAGDLSSQVILKQDIITITQHGNNEYRIYFDAGKSNESEINIQIYSDALIYEVNMMTSMNRQGL